jgi:phosphoribosylformylglycinamidine (FGAM) synthase-like enzyme
LPIGTVGLFFAFARICSSYAPCPDITLTVTPDFKRRGGVEGILVWVPLSGLSPLPSSSSLSSSSSSPSASSSLPHNAHRPRSRLGGSALAQCFGQLGAADQCPDVDDVALLMRAFDATQKLLPLRVLIAAGHDVSDGGLLTAALEMAFAGDCGVEFQLPAFTADAATGTGTAHEIATGTTSDTGSASGAGTATGTASATGTNAASSPSAETLAALFAEECGLVLECSGDAAADTVIAAYAAAHVSAYRIGRTRADHRAVVRDARGAAVLDADVRDLVCVCVCC